MNMTEESLVKIIIAFIQAFAALLSKRKGKDK